MAENRLDQLYQGLLDSKQELSDPAMHVNWLLQTLGMTFLPEVDSDYSIATWMIFEIEPSSKNSFCGMGKWKAFGVECERWEEEQQTALSLIFAHNMTLLKSKATG